MITDHLYCEVLRIINNEGEAIETRNHAAISCMDVPTITFVHTPLVTVRKTAWKKALRELEWFMSGDDKCPEELLDWWEDQLNVYDEYTDGYSTQFRHSPTSLYVNKTFDQINYLLNGLRNNPNSRRLVMTTWNPYDMAHITLTNQNDNCPTCCHGSLIQLFVRQKHLFMTHYQRSADCLLGLPHNFIQYWALLLYFARHANYQVGALKFVLGDAHLYLEDSHVAATNALLSLTLDAGVDQPFELTYNPTCDMTEPVPEFRAADFTMQGVIPEPKVLIRPKLL
jgi:thymidylate synthase